MSAGGGAALGSGDLRWDAFPLVIQKDSAMDPSASSDLNDAIAFWETKAGRQLFVISSMDWPANVAPYTGTTMDPDDLLGNVIFFQNPWPFDASVAGRTIVHSSNNSITNAVILINTTNLCGGDCLTATSGHDVSRRRLFAHELGHFLGMGHSSSTANIMHKDIQPGTTLSTMEVDMALLEKLTP